MRLRRRGPEVFLGLDLSPGRIKLVGLSSSSDGPLVACAADRPWRHGRGTRFDPAEIGGEIAALVSELRVRPRGAALVLGSGEAISRRVSLVEQAREQMLAAVALQLAPALGAAVAAPRVAFVPLGGRGVSGRRTVLAAAARPDAAAAHQRSVEAAGLEQGPVTTTAAALLNAWRACRSDGAERRVVLLHAGESGALWIVLDGGEPVALDAPLVGFAAVRERSGVSGAAAGALAEWAGRLRQEIERGLQQIRRESGDSAAPLPHEVWVSGGAAAAPGVHDALRAALAVPVHLFDPLALLPAEGIRQAPFGPALVPALGAALQAMPDGGAGARLFGIDLQAPLAHGTAPGGVPLPLLLRRVTSDRAYRALALAALCLWGGAAALEGRQRAALAALAERGALVRADSAAVAGAMFGTREIEERRRAVGDRAEAAARLERRRGTWPRLLAGVAAAVPDAAWVSDLVQEGEDPVAGDVRFRLRGYAASEAAASEFVRRLGSVAEGAALGPTARVRIGRSSAVQFEITGHAKAGGLP